MPDVLAKCGRGRSREEQAQDDKLVHVKPLVWFLSWGGGGGLACTVEPLFSDTLGSEGTVLIMRTSSFQGLRMYYGKAWGVIWFEWDVST